MANLPTFSPATPRPYDEADAQAVGAAILSGHLSVVFGRETIRFENEFARMIGSRYAVALSSGTQAIELALQVLGVGYGDEVVVPAYTFATTALAALRQLAVVRFADINPLTWNVSRETIETTLTEKTKAVIIVHMFGNPVEMQPVMALARDRGIAVIEDVAQAAGGETEGKAAGGWGDLSCFSFNEIKNLTTGEGGMVTVNDPALADRLRTLRLHGAKNGVAVDLGTKCTMTEMEAALGRKQLAKLAGMNASRRDACLPLRDGVNALPGLSAQVTPADGRHVYSRFVIRVDAELAGMDRAALSAGLKDRGFALDPVYPVPLYRHPLFRDLAEGTPPTGLAASYAKIHAETDAVTQFADMSLPNVEKFCAEQIGFIVPADVRPEQTDALLTAIKETLGR